MRVLLISLAPVHRGFGSGNTLLNLAEMLEDAELASLCARSGETDPAVTRAFCVTEGMLARNLFLGTSVGRVEEPGKYGRPPEESSAGRRLQRFAHRHRWTVLFWARDLLWRIGRWRSPELKRFLKDFQPDLILTFLSGTPHLNRLILHAAQETGAGLAVCAWDNNYTYRQLTLSPLRWIKQFSDRFSMRRLAARADVLYAICDDLKSAYEKAFGREFRLLTKGGDFSGEPPIKDSDGRPLQLVYAGNLQNRRWRSLAAVASVLERINAEEFRIQLRIYTGSSMSRRVRSLLDRGESSVVMGKAKPSDIPRILAEADVLVHAEATDLKNRLAVRHSFSTKLVDYMAAARPILAYGGKDTASVRYLVERECGVAADSPEELYGRLMELIRDEAARRELGEKAYACGRRYHNREDIREQLKKDVQALMSHRRAPHDSE
ncbi:MAG: glycosyltransferase [Ruminococcaceae bacterium]|nr:glycosyltransferase [Oscillospiraceae bacterium]